jgi:GT2 family glycosyltransferase
VVDNASGDGSVEALAHEFPGVEVLALEHNGGYTAGNNRGIERFLDGGADFIQVLNPDVEVVEGGYVGRVVEAFGRHPDWGAAGPLVFLRDRHKVQRTWLWHPTLGSVLRDSLASRPGWFPPEEAPGEEREVEAVNGACLFLRAEAAREAGGFDESFFMYCEEQDLCRRLAGLDWKSGLVPVPSIIHYQREGEAPGFGLRHNLTRANQVRFLRRHRGLLSAAAAAGWLAGTGLMKALAGRGPGLGRYLACLGRALAGAPASPAGARGEGGAT